MKIARELYLPFSRKVSTCEWLQLMIYLFLELHLNCHKLRFNYANKCNFSFLKIKNFSTAIMENITICPLLFTKSLIKSCMNRRKEKKRNSNEKTRLKIYVKCCCRANTLERLKLCFDLTAFRRCSKYYADNVAPTVRCAKSKREKTKQVELCKKKSKLHFSL